ncbi:hypothetical protein CEXT_647791 [Caerostris extrusa]|uniref:Uncharacterized protein n=1 Tax=Caerostris extrusa TaxID=172846 RepID=A0AAV4T0F0_CAEEX|nr:hypothetical protein CEXT_647791 [Caerostris extrusa]
MWVRKEFIVSSQVFVISVKFPPFLKISLFAKGGVLALSPLRPQRGSEAHVRHLTLPLQFPACLKCCSVELSSV